MLRSIRGALPALALAQLLTAGPAEAATIRFAGSVTVVQHVTDATNMLGAPDAAVGAFHGPAFEVPGEAVFASFGAAQSYSDTGLAALLGVSPTLLASADFIIVDINRLPDLSASDGFETSTHTFSDGVGTRVVPHTYLGVSGPEVVATGRVVASAYDAFFGSTTPPPAGGYFTYGFLLIDLEAGPGVAVDVRSPNFSWRIEGESLSSGTPDADFLGVFVPEPALALLLWAGASALARGVAVRSRAR